ncbi:unnamed protein product [Didymodactylos carnosus]|nr:unnamed protein product [Didymodactylos carnosus]CAF4095192.1 unnamed protein product [Didymodactylos carnosus]
MSLNIKAALLLLTRPLSSDLNRSVPSLLLTVKPHVQSRLLIYLNPMKSLTQQQHEQLKPIQLTKNDRLSIRDFTTSVYSALTCFDHDLSVDVLLQNFDGEQITLPDYCQAVFTDSQQSVQLIKEFCTKQFGQKLEENFILKYLTELTAATSIEAKDHFTVSQTESDLLKENFTFDNGVLGGTFDHLHNGHKLLLSDSALLCDKKLVIGVTDGAMIQNKGTELIEPVSVRMEHVRSFINDIRPMLNVHCEPITDPYGPSITMPDLDCIIVTEETKDGAIQVNEKRNNNGLSQLAVHIVPILPSDKNKNNDDDVKISSTSLRRQLLGRLLKPVKKQSQSNSPYILGLTGGMGAGKTSIANRLEKLGAGIVDCDKLGHETYQVNTDAYKKIIEVFGDDILSTEDKTINRKLLGRKVFEKPNELKKLTDIVWPEILILANKKIEQLYNQGKRVIILDAAVLLEAKWDSVVNEIWVAVIPPKEAIRRICERDHLSNDDAQRRLSNQMTNAERVNEANVVLCTYWETYITQNQVQLAWNLLMERI